VTGSNIGKVFLIRHGETAWSRTGQHIGRTDVPLDDEGRAQARAVGDSLTGMRFDLALVSPLSRARETADLCGVSKAASESDIDADLLEWDYGAWEGRTTSDIRAELNDAEWTVWTGPIPQGESAEDVELRARRVLHRIAPQVDDGGRVALVAHGHFLRILTAAWLGRPARDARLWALSPATVSILGFEHEQHVILRWNCPSG
jgi:broad specificity phosphatase PhoE